MVTSVQFEKTTRLVAWRQQRSSTNNMVCGQIGCYSNCEFDYKANIPFALSSVFRGSCRTCKHSLWDHRCHYAQWEKVIDVQVSVDQDMKKKWEGAKDAKEKREVFIAACRKALNDLDHVINRVTDDLKQRVKRHESLALGGSFSGQVSSTVRLLDRKYKALRETKDISPDHLAKIQTSLDRMTRRLDILNIAKENTQEVTIRIGS